MTRAVALADNRVVIEIEINNSYSQILGLTREQYSKLKGTLSYRIDNYNTRLFYKKSLLEKDGHFPTGLLYLVYETLGKLDLEFEVNDLRRKPQVDKGNKFANRYAGFPGYVALESTFKSRLGVPPYPEQTDAFKACLRKNRGIITAPTGVGKSVIIGLIAGGIGVKSLIVVPTLELKRQLTATLVKAFGDKQVGTLRQRRHITVENIDALPIKAEPYRGIDCVIIDEFHHSAANTYRQLNKKAWKDVYYRFGLTATPFRSQDNERLLLESVLSEVIYRIEHRVAVEKGYIVPMEAYFINLPKVPVEGSRYAQVYAELVAQNERRNDIIADILRNLNDSGKAALCLVKEIKHGNSLWVKTGFSFASGENEETASLIAGFNSKGSGVLIGTTGILGEGVDTKPCEYVIIAGLGRSKNAFMQQVGRGLRIYPGKESCKVILFRDSSHKYTLAHFREQCKILAEEYGVVPAKLEVI